MHSSRSARALSGTRRRILDFIEENRDLRGAPPTIREIASALGIRSTNGVIYHLDRLEQEGWIRRRRGCARGIASGESGAAQGIPILGRIAAGSPVSAEENFEGRLDGDRLGRLTPDFALRVTGDSMRDAGILEGDLILVRSGSEPRDGEIVVALIGDETTVKRFFRRKREIVLQAENPRYAPIRLTPDSPEVRILGKVVGVYREFGQGGRPAGARTIDRDAAAGRAGPSEGKARRERRKP